MRYIWLSNQNPQHNLAVEEYLLKQCSDEIFMLWQNSDAVIIGRHQNTLSEIDLKYVKDNNIAVVRRLTGGGAVFHDTGNLNFTFIKNIAPNEKEIDFKKYTYPIINALQFLGIQATLSGRNDLTINGKKISGNAMIFHGNRVLEHGTLLFSTQKSKLTQSLKVDPTKFIDKAVKSIQSRVTNISDHLSTTMNVLEFKDYIMTFVMQQNPESVVEQLSEEEEKVIEQLMVEKYNTWDWNFGKSPKYSINRKIRTTGGTIQLMMEVQRGVIEEIRFFGDYFSKQNTEELEQKLKGVEHEKKVISNILDGVDIASFFCHATKEDILSLMF